MTTELDMFTDHRWAAEMRREQRDGPVTDRADLFSAGTLVTAPGGHGTEYPIEVPTLDDPDGADAFVAARIAEGSDYIKVVFDAGESYGLEFPTLSEPTLQAVVTAAHRHGKLVVVHIGTREAARQAIAAGSDGLVHVFSDQPIDEALVKAAVKHQIFVVPTLTVIESLAGATGSSTSIDQDFAELLSGEQSRTLHASFPVSQDSRVELEVAREAVQRLHRAGVPILAGTDAPNPGTTHGVSLHRELELLVATGLTPVQALQSATSVPADTFGLSDRGRIAPDLKADLVLVEGNPAIDITATRRIVSIWKDGSEVARSVQGREPTTGNGQTVAPGLISDFDDGSLSARTGFGWSPSTDEMMGGASTVELSVIPGGPEGSTHYLELEGTIAEGALYPWAGAIYFPGQQPMTAADLSGSSELVFLARGQGTLRVLVFADSLGWIPAEHAVELDTTWHEHVIPFTAFPNADPAGIKGILLSAGTEHGEFSIALDRVELR